MPLPDLSQILSTPSSVPQTIGSAPVTPTDRSRYLEALSRTVREKSSQPATSGNDRAPSQPDRPERDLSSSRRQSDDRRVSRQNSQSNASAETTSSRKDVPSDETNRPATTGGNRSASADKQAEANTAANNESAQQTERHSSQSSAENTRQGTSGVPENLAAAPPMHIAELFEEVAETESSSSETVADPVRSDENSEPRPPAGLVNLLNGRAVAAQSPLPAQAVSISTGSNANASNAASATSPDNITPLEDIPVILTEETTSTTGNEKSNPADGSSLETGTAVISADETAGTGSTVPGATGEIPTSRDSNSDENGAEKTDASAENRLSQSLSTPAITAPHSVTSGPLSTTGDSGGESIPTSSTAAGDGDGSSAPPVSGSSSSTTGASPLMAGSETTATSGSSASRSLPSSVDSARNDFAQRVVEAVRSAVAGERSFRIRLHPPELGVLQVEIGREEGLLIARLEVQTAAARQALTENLSHLKASLQRHGVSLDRIDIQLDQSRQEEGSGQTSRDQSQNQSFAEPHQQPRDNSSHQSPSRDEEETSILSPAESDIPVSEAAHTAGATARGVLRPDDLDVQI